MFYRLPFWYPTYLNIEQVKFPQRTLAKHLKTNIMLNNNMILIYLSNTKSNIKV